MEAYFYNCINTQDVSIEYRKLAKINHPDKGGELTIMTEINKQYEIARNSIHTYKSKYHEIIIYRKEILDLKIKIAQFYDLCRNDTNLSNKKIIFEIIKKTIFISGNTFDIKEKLKENKFKWNQDFKCWTFSKNGVFKTYISTLDEYRELNIKSVIKLIQK